MRNYETNGVIKNGVLSIRNRKLFDKAVLSFGDCEIELKISKKSRKRTSPQNRYYWGVIVFYWQQILEQEHGDHVTQAQTHGFLKSNFNYFEIVNKETGECLRLPKSTTENNKIAPVSEQKTSLKQKQARAISIKHRIVRFKNAV